MENQNIKPINKEAVKEEKWFYDPIEDARWQADRIRAIVNHLDVFSDDHSFR